MFFMKMHAKSLDLHENHQKFICDTILVKDCLEHLMEIYDFHRNLQFPIENHRKMTWFSLHFLMESMAFSKQVRNLYCDTIEMLVGLVKTLKIYKFHAKH